MKRLQALEDVVSLHGLMVQDKVIHLMDYDDKTDLEAILGNRSLHLPA
ncbi:hypothetical protein [Cohnella rhizosphaerae]|uniref:Uncharacterized protein n=1 Tax=Cohnella rhizosphaerae TaxID=1457232 RepID=A0A9X4QUM5_9BACL|nr:hypothetical protein [Cohnella rhizosphaerae]MDG0810627.1 hypothetical protein [Cohnella rhizosphaerae]